VPGGVLTEQRPVSVPVAPETVELSEPHEFTAGLCWQPDVVVEAASVGCVEELTIGLGQRSTDCVLQLYQLRWVLRTEWPEDDPAPVFPKQIFAHWHMVSSVSLPKGAATSARRRPAAAPSWRRAFKEGVTGGPVS